MCTHLITLLTLIPLCLTSPHKHLSKDLQYFDTLPWKLSNIIVFESTANSTTPSSINFDLADPNPGLEETTHCTNTVPAGTNLTSQSYLPCGTKGMGFSYRGDSIWIHHLWQDQQQVKTNKSPIPPKQKKKKKANISSKANVSLCRQLDNVLPLQDI
jgi:hypothetical protein